MRHKYAVVIRHVERAGTYAVKAIGTIEIPGRGTVSWTAHRLPHVKPFHCHAVGAWNIYEGSSHGLSSLRGTPSSVIRARLKYHTALPE